MRFYVAQMALAIGHMHKHGCVHRDLKPENVFPDEDGYVKLTDFGLVKSDMFGPATTGPFCGTRDYIARKW